MQPQSIVKQILQHWRCLDIIKSFDELGQLITNELKQFYIPQNAYATVNTIFQGIETCFARNTPPCPPPSGSAHEDSRVYIMPPTFLSTISLSVLSSDMIPLYMFNRKCNDSYSTTHPMHRQSGSSDAWTKNSQSTWKNNSKKQTLLV